MPKCDFSKVASEHLWRAASVNTGSTAIYTLNTLVAN